MQKLIVWVMVAVAVVYLVRKYYKNLNGTGKGCGGECCSCGQKDVASPPGDCTIERKTPQETLEE